MPSSHAKPVALGFIILLAATVGCRFSPASNDTSQQTGFLPLTLVAERTPSPPALQGCPVPAGDPSPPALDQPLQRVADIERFLNAGGQPGDLSSSALQVDVSRVDLQADGWIDLVVTWRHFDGEEEAGMALVFDCQETRYHLVYTSSASAEAGPPQLEIASDLNGMPGDELLLTRSICGAHTCSLQLQALVWINGQLQHRLEGITDDLPGGYVEIRVGEAGEQRIVVSSTGINSVGAGPYRPVSRQWAWSNELNQFALVDETELPSDYRIHKLHDAERAAAAGQLQLAEAAYRAVATDTNLTDWIEPAREQEVLGAYARFKLVTLAGLIGDAGLVGQRLIELRQAHAGSQFGAAYVEMGEAYAQVFQVTQDATQACLEARAYAAAHPAGILDPLYFGYANPVPTANDMCQAE